jgi:hypothetical protein
MSYVLTRLLNDLELAQQLTKTAFADLNKNIHGSSPVARRIPPGHPRDGLRRMARPMSCGDSHPAARHPLRDMRDFAHA